MQWTTAAVEKLISLYRAQPCLYNNRMKEYRDQVVKKQAYQFIKSGLQDVRRGTTEEDIKSKIASLRGAYSQEYAKMNKNPSYKSNKWFFPHLDAFLKDFTRNASRDRNRSSSRDGISEVDSTVDGDDTRDSFLRGNMSTPLSFYGGASHIGRDSPIFSRGRAGAPSPAPSLYGQEAEPFISEFDKQLESKSCESIASEGAQYFSIPKTLSGIDPSIFDQPTLLDIEVSPAPSPQQPPPADSGMFEQPSILRSSVVPSPNVSPILKEDSEFSMRSNSPVKQLFVNNDEVQIACEIVVPTNNMNNKVVEGKTSEKRSEPVFDFSRPSTSKEVEIVENTEKNLGSNKNSEAKISKAESTPKLKSAESQTDDCVASNSKNDQNTVETERKVEDQPGPSTTAKDTKRVSQCTDDPKPGPSWASDDYHAEAEKVSEEVRPAISKSNETSSKQQRSPKRKPYKTVCTYYDSGSDSEYFSAEEFPSPVKKKRKFSHVTHYYYPPQPKNEDDAFFSFYRFLYDNAAAKIGKKAVRMKMLSALD